MRSWLGAVAVAAVVLVAPGVALAGPDDPAQVQFKLPSGTRSRSSKRSGSTWITRIEATADGGALVSAWVTDAQLAAVEGARLRAGGDDRRQERDRPHPRRARRDDRRQAGRRARAGRERRRPAGRERRPGRGAGAACRLLREQRRALPVDRGEPRRRAGQLPERRRRDAPARWSSPSGTTPPATASAAATSASTTTRLIPDYYQYHFPVFRVGNKGDGGVLPATIKVAAPNGDVDTLDVREWIAKDPPPPGPGFLSGFVTHYNDSQEAYKKMRDLAAEFSNISQAYKLPEQTRGYQRKAQTMLGYVNQPTTQNPNPNPPTRPRRTCGSTPTTCRSQAPRPSTAQQPSTVVLTSKAYGHLGGNNLTAQLVDPGAAERGAERQHDRQRDPRRPGHRRRGRDHQHRGAGRRRAQRLPAVRRRRDSVAVPHLARQPAWSWPARSRR